MELIHKNKFGERLVLKLIGNKVWFKHDDITDEFERLSGRYAKEFFGGDRYVFDKDERIVIKGFLEMCGELLDT